MEVCSSMSSVTQTVDLSSQWKFAYRGDADGKLAGQTLLPINEVQGAMSVPGFWDDHLANLREASGGESLRQYSQYQPIRLPMENPPPDASLPYVVGVGQYDTTFKAPETGRVRFACGPVFLEAWLWIDGRLVAHQSHYSTPWTVPLDEHIKPGAQHRLTLQVANTQPHTMGCITRGFKGYSAGVAGPTLLRMTGPAAIADVYAYPCASLETLHWSVQIDHRTASALQLQYRVIDSHSNAVVLEGRKQAKGTWTRWTTSTDTLQPWSDETPKLYTLEVTLYDGEQVSDQWSQSFGLRRLVPDGFSLKLNGRPIFLRGATEHAYFPQTCTVPLDKSVHRAHIARLKELGFNWLRFHTWVPPEPYLAAADELGMLIQVEAPVAADDEMWADIVMACRRHPSVVIYCGGNEELLDETNLNKLERWAAISQAFAPDALFNPQEALRGVEYVWNASDFGQGRVDEPFAHNPERLERLKSFSDCFGQFSWAMLSYRSASGDAAQIDHRLARYERPCLSHEVCIHGSYLNLDLEHRYVGTRIGPDMYAATRAYLQEHDLAHRAAEYYVNSCAWMRRLRKHAIETARRCRRLAGYDLLGARDYHWHRTGYPCGIMNEFDELKPGETAADVRRYNGPNVLLLEQGHAWTITAGRSWAADVLASIFTADDPSPGQVIWRLVDQGGRVFRRGRWDVSEVSGAGVTQLGQVAFTTDEVVLPIALVLEVEFECDGLHIENQWPLWVYPPVEPMSASIQADDGVRRQWSAMLSQTSDAAAGEFVRVVNELTPSDLEALEQGDRVLLLGPGPLPVRATTDQIACAGRAEGNLATCIHDHPVTRTLPHAGYCDWDFHHMIETGHAVMLDAVADESGETIKPIVEIVSSFKAVCLQAALLEFNVGAGRLLVCTLGLTSVDPAAAYLFRSCIQYLQASSLVPAATVSPGTLRRWIDRGERRQGLAATDQGFDERANVAR